MSEQGYSKLDTEVQAKCNTFNFTVPSVFWIWAMIIIAVIAIVVNYLYLFRVIPGRPTENYTNSDYYNENDYYKQY